MVKKERPDFAPLFRLFLLNFFHFIIVLGFAEVLQGFTYRLSNLGQFAWTNYNEQYDQDQDQFPWSEISYQSEQGLTSFTFTRPSILRQPESKAY